MVEKFGENLTEAGNKKESFLATPFNKPLTETEFGEGDKLRYLGQNKDKIVRILLLSKSGREEGKFSLEEYKIGREVFRKMNKEYDIAVPKTELIMGREKIKIRSSPKKMFMVVEKVYGDSLDKAKSLPQEALAEVDKFCTAILKFYQDVYKNGGSFWIDIDLKNLMFGHVKGENRDRVYIFDPDPFFITFDKTKPIGDFKESDNFYFDTVLDSKVPSIIRNLESKFAQPAKLVETRKFFREIISNMRERDAKIVKTYGSLKDFV